jgi:hypothetical protein
MERRHPCLRSAGILPGSYHLGEECEQDAREPPTRMSALHLKHAATLDAYYNQHH